MGITRELARSVFSKSRSFGTHDSPHNHNQKRRFRAVRSYLCGDELINSVIAEEDSASIKSSEFTISYPISNSYGTTIVNIGTETENSEITVTQPVNAVFDNESEIQSNENSNTENENSETTQFCKEDAAMVIQSAFRGFLERRRRQKSEMIEREKEMFSEIASPTRGSVGTSVEVQTGNSIEMFSTRAEIMAVHNRMKSKGRGQVSRLKEDWDDSTVSSNIIKLRMQNRLEATTRRERALAYAFSQQLRICTKKKQSRCDHTEPNMGWSWLERWMATRAKENEFEDREINEIESVSINLRSSQIRKRLFDLPGEEMESCGSNEVSALMVSDSYSTTNEKYDTGTNKNRLKATRSISKRKTVPSSPYPGEFSKSSKKECPKEEERDKKNKPKQQAIKSENTTSQMSADDVASNNS